MGKGLSITAFVFAFIFPLVGLILGIIAINKAKDDPGALKGLAIATTIIGGIFTLVSIIVIIFVAIAWTQVVYTDGEIFPEESFMLSAPLVADSFTMNTNSDSIDFVIRNGFGEKINIDKIKVSDCSTRTFELSQVVSIESGQLGTIHYEAGNDCIIPEQRFTSDITIYYTPESSTLENMVIGTILGTPN